MPCKKKKKKNESVISCGEAEDFKLLSYFVCAQPVKTN
jgi:hypothetical protein